jgi:branched-chain amino acid transport system ATP-binding protein
MTLTVRNVSAGYAGANVIHDVSMTVDPGERLALLGANGAGKSTLAKVLGGLLRPQTGEIYLDDTDLRSLRPYRYAAAGIRWVGDPRPIYSEMSVNDNLIIGGFTKPRQIKDRLSQMYDRFPELASRRGVKAGSLSGGQSQILAIAQALMSEPQVILLDEPSIGLAVSILDRLGEIVSALSREGVAVLWSEQFPDLVLRHCDSAMLMVGGYCRAKVRTAELDAATVEAAYFGAEQAG